MNLLHAIELHMRRTGKSASRIGREALNDSRLVRDLRCGRELRPQTYQRLRAYLRPEGR